jgi:hypothetical protein
MGMVSTDEVILCVAHLNNGITIILTLSYGSRPPVSISFDFIPFGLEEIGSLLKVRVP